MGLGQDMIRALIAVTGRPVVPELIRQLRDTAPGRAAAAFVLGKLRARDAVGDLIKVLDGEADGFVAAECVRALGKIADPAAVPALVNASRHRLAIVRAAALGALAGFDDPLVAEAALAACDDFDPDVRDGAVRLLACRGDQRAVSRLLSACDGPLAPIALRGASGLYLRGQPAQMRATAWILGAS
jgi:HEAT repeat protein